MTAPVVLPTVVVREDGSVYVELPSATYGSPLVFPNVSVAQVAIHAASVGLAAAETRYLRSQDPELFA